MTGTRMAGACAALVASILASCGSLLPPSPSTDYTIHVENGTTIAVSILVNDRFIGFADPGRAADFPVDVLPPPPWSVAARSPSGRLLAEMAVAPGDIQEPVTIDGVTTRHGTGARADLSCGRLDIWVGAPMLGPAPAPGVPGDCA